MIISHSTAKTEQLQTYFTDQLLALDRVRQARAIRVFIEERAGMPLFVQELPGLREFLETVIKNL